MLSFKMTGNLDHIRDRIRHWMQIDTLPLAEEIKKILEEDNDVWLSQGIDVYGQPMEEIKRSTFERGRGGGPKGRPDSRHGQSSYGPPLDPRYNSSRLITGFVVEIVAGHEGAGTNYIIRAGWPGLEWVKYHQTGYQNHGTSVPARAPAGFRDSTNKRIDEAITRFCLKFTGV